MIDFGSPGGRFWRLRAQFFHDFRMFLAECAENLPRTCRGLAQLVDAYLHRYASVASHRWAEIFQERVGGGLKPPGGGPPPPHPPSEDLGPTVRGHRSLAIEGRRPQAAQDLGKFWASSRQVLGIHGRTHAKILKRCIPEPPKSRPGASKIEPGAHQDVIFIRHLT